MYENIYSTYHVSLKPPAFSGKDVKQALKELKGYQVAKPERKEAVRYALSFNQNGSSKC